MYGIFAYIYHKNQPNISYMDPMGYVLLWFTLSNHQTIKSKNKQACDFSSIGPVERGKKFIGFKAGKK